MPVDAIYPKHSPEVSLVLFTLGEEVYSVPVDLVTEVVDSYTIVPFPSSVDYVRGFINLRGKVVSVVDIKRKFELPVSVDSSNTEQILVIDYGNTALGVLVDAVQEVFTVAEDVIQEPPQEFLSKIGSEFITGIILPDTVVAPLEGATLDQQEGVSGEESLGGSHRSNISLTEVTENRAILIVDLTKLLKSFTS
jgi:purine-binding chemotaxis protein CheW